MKTIGILGGMGPFATVDIFQKIVANTQADTDQEHIRIVLDSNPQIPSRQSAILANGESPLPKMIDSAKGLVRMGASCMLIPCDTAHYWYEEIVSAIPIPVLHIIEIAAEYAATNYRQAQIMLCATSATVKSGMYQNAFAKHFMALTLPDSSGQALIDTLIHTIKMGRIRDNPALPAFQEMLDAQYTAGITVFIGGCTEIPLIFPYLSGEFVTIDPNLLLARRAILLAKKE